MTTDAVGDTIADIGKAFDRLAEALLAMDETAWDVDDVARYLDVSPQTVRRMFADGEIPGRRVGRRWLTTRDAVIESINNRE